MAWVKIDDSFADHPKVVALPDKALALWIRAACYCARHLTDGVIPSGALRPLGGTRAAAKALVSARLWEETEGGYRFHDWAEYQPTRDAVSKERAKAASRMRGVRANKRRTSCEPEPDGGGLFGRSSHCPVPVPINSPHVPPAGGTPRSDEPPSEIAEVLAAMTKAVKALNPANHGPRDNPENRKAIRRPMKACSATVDDWRAVIDRQLISVRSDPEKWKFLTLSTLSVPKNFERILNDPASGSEKKNGEKLW